MSEIKNETMKVLFVASEALPFASTGGLADVIGSLPPILKKEGVDARVVIPYYSVFKQKNLPEISFLFDFRVGSGFEGGIACGFGFVAAARGASCQSRSGQEQTQEQA